MSFWQICQMSNWRAVRKSTCGALFVHKKTRMEDPKFIEGFLQKRERFSRKNLSFTLKRDSSLFAFESSVVDGFGNAEHLADLLDGEFFVFLQACEHG